MPESYRQHTRRRQFFVYHLPAIIYAIAILVVSSIPNLNPPAMSFEFSDKIIHFIEYAVFAFLIYRSISHINININKRQVFILCTLFLSLFALLDELHQRFVPGRHSDILDFVGDFLGAVIVLIYLHFRNHKR